MNSIAFNYCGVNETITEGKIVFTIYNKYYIVFQILDNDKFLGIDFHNYKDKAAFLEISDVLEVFELPKNTKVLLFKKCERIVENHFGK